MSLQSNILGPFREKKHAFSGIAGMGRSLTYSRDKSPHRLALNKRINISILKFYCISTCYIFTHHSYHKLILCHQSFQLWFWLKSEMWKNILHFIKLLHSNLRNITNINKAMVAENNEPPFSIRHWNRTISGLSVKKTHCQNGPKFNDWRRCIRSGSTI